MPKIYHCQGFDLPNKMIVRKIRLAKWDQNQLEVAFDSLANRQQFHNLSQISYILRIYFINVDAWIFNEQVHKDFDSIVARLDGKHTA